MNCFEQIMELGTSLSTEINTYQQMSIHKRRCPNTNKYECIPASINKYHYLSTKIFKYKQIWIHINRYQYIQLASIIKYRPQIFGVGPVALPRGFVLCQYHVKTYYMAPKSFHSSAGNAGTTERSARSIHINRHIQI